MDDAEYRLVLRSQIMRSLFAVAIGIGGGAVAAVRMLPLGIVPTALIALAFGYGIGGKFFPDSGGVLRRRFRNYRRAKKGLPLLAEDEVPIVGYFDEYRKG